MMRHEGRIDDDSDTVELPAYQPPGLIPKAIGIFLGLIVALLITMICFLSTCVGIHHA